MENKNRMYLDIHILQTVPPSCINRDDTGSPKTAVYGGVTRARVSSQSWKHAMRADFAKLFPDEMLGKRTKRIVYMVEEEIRRLDEAADAEALAMWVLKQKLKIKDKEKGTDALYFMSLAQAKALAEFALAEGNGTLDKWSKEQKERLDKAFKAAPGAELALFGRMVADDPSLNNDACAQVAHSISTHKVNNEYDYFTAVDDCKENDESGAGHIGTVEFNSATLYRYATVAVHDLNTQLGNLEDTAKTARNFVDAFVRSMPTGKQNSFANRTPAALVYVTVRHDQPVNLVGAFEEPVKSAAGGFVKPSADRLLTYANDFYADYAEAPAHAFAMGRVLADVPAAAHVETMSLKDLLDRVESTVIASL